MNKRDRRIRITNQFEEETVDLHDFYVTGMELFDDRIRFKFDDGFNVYLKDHVFRTKNGCVDILNCKPENSDINIYVLERITNIKGVRLNGRWWSENELMEALDQKKVSIEFAYAFYNQRRVLWRGWLRYCELDPQHRRLSDIVVIEMYCNGPPIVQYSWESETDITKLC